jgi:hypothetical protein
MTLTPLPDGDTAVTPYVIVTEPDHGPVGSTRQRLVGESAQAVAGSHAPQ